MISGLLRLKKGSYFFVLDAFVAGIVLAAAVSAIFASYTYKESPSQAYYLTEDFISFLEQTPIKGYSGEKVFDMVRTGVITNTDFSLLEEAIILYDKNTTDSRGNLSLMLSEVSSLAPSNSGLAYYITVPDSEPEIVYSTKPLNEILSSRVRLASHRVVTVFNQENIIGPYIFEVDLWR